MSILIDIEKKLGDFFLKVKFEAGDETLALLGASGCGKSLTLRCIAGIEKPDRGKIIVNGVTLFDSDKRIHLVPQKRRTGLLFQNYALFPNMTVEQNICAGAKRAGNKKQQKEAACQIMERFELTNLAHHYPHQLSGGQKQRTALARLLVSKPDILMLDEPFSALDSHLRLKLEQDVREVIKQYGKTVLLVSHDRDEVFRLSDRVALMHQGRIPAIGEKREVFNKPMTIEGAILTGCRNVSEVKQRDSQMIFAEEWGLFISIQEDDNITELKAIGIRSQDICLGAGENGLRCTVLSEMEQPHSWEILLKPENGKGVLFWEPEKALWEQNRAEIVDVWVPNDAILRLRG